jgi:conjugal transfer/entry exclusion protein
MTTASRLICILMVLLGFAAPARAQIVFDPSNYSQNVLTAARTLEQINNQVKSLAADPARLRAVQQQCREDWAKTGVALCNAASQAFRRRFMGSGQTPYTPHAVDMFPSLNEDGSPKINAKPKTE